MNDAMHTNSRVYNQLVYSCTRLCCVCRYWDCEKN